MSWNYRVVKDIEFGIKEVYYNKDGKVCTMTENFVYPHGESFEELCNNIQNYLEALEKPILDAEEIEYAKSDWDHKLSKADLLDVDEAWLQILDDDLDDDYLAEGEE